MSFVIRNTSPIGWVPILLMKAGEIDFATVMVNYVNGALIIFLPIFGISVAADSYYYGEMTIVPWNFIKINVFEGLSQTFGSDPLFKYIQVELPARYNIFFPCVILGTYHFVKQSWANR